MPTVRGRTLQYDKFVLATGSRLFQPPVPGLAEHSFNVDQLENARALDGHLKSLAGRPETVARNTVVVAGGGFTGIETVAEMPERLRAVLGSDAAIRVIVVEQAPHIGPDLGPNPRPVIEQALAECGVEIITGAAVTSISADGVTLSSGERIETNTRRLDRRARAQIRWRPRSPVSTTASAEWSAMPSSGQERWTTSLSPAMSSALQRTTLATSRSCRVSTP